MKKQLESELLSIAHKILKLTGREDLGKMQTEIALLYQKITILKFIEEHYDGQAPESVELDSSFFESLEPAQEQLATVVNSEVHKQEEHNKSEQELEIPETEIEETGSLTAAAVDQSEEETEESPVLELQSEPQLEETTTPLNEPTEHDLSELSPSYNQLPIFDAVEDATQMTSLNNQLKSQGFQVGLNDRLAFVKSLFENSNEDYDRVLSQLSTLDSYEQATSLLNSIIKPDYNNWEGQEDIEARFLDIIEKKFN
tara:strand:- start:3376 stop:4143 length:768 start_codon:yes stop_codon:yes gene_type:complete